jgi:large subunit ribosomal protein L4
MLKIDNYSLKGTKLDQFSLPKEYETKINLPLLAQAVRVYFDRTHVGFAKTKTRAEINRTKKKWYKQKGTGGARHGAKSAPIFVGGGVAHGPQPVKRTLTLPEKMRRKALLVALNLKIKEGGLVVVNDLAKIKKTSEAGALLTKIGGERFTFVLAEESKNAVAALRNLKNVNVIFRKDLNSYQVWAGGKVIFDKAVFSNKKGRARKVAKKQK